MNEEKKIQNLTTMEIVRLVILEQINDSLKTTFPPRVAIFTIKSFGYSLIGLNISISIDLITSRCVEEASL